MNTNMQKRIDKTLNFIKSNNGVRIPEIQRHVGISHSQVVNAIMKIETQGTLLCEDERGAITIYEPIDLL